MDYGPQRKTKFLCGIVLQIENLNYYVPVTSYKQQNPDNFLIKADNGQAERTYKRVLLAKNPGLVANSCDFNLLEQAYFSYVDTFLHPR